MEEEAVVAGNDPLRVVVSINTPDSRAEKVALDVGSRIMSLLSRSPETLVFRENKPDVVIVRARYDADQLQYIW